LTLVKVKVGGQFPRAPLASAGFQSAAYRPNRPLGAGL